MYNQHVRLSHRQRMGYGVGELGPTSAEVLIRVSLLIFYTDFVGLRPELAGFAVALGILWDAITDPLMGRISDRSRFAGGRRRPFILAGSIWLALSLIVLFFPPQLDSQLAMFGYLVVGYMLVNTGVTIISVPHAALAGDLTEAPQERTTLFAWRMLFANLGLVLGTIVPGLILTLLGGEDSLVNRQHADQVTAQVIAITAMLACIVTFFSTKGRDVAVHKVDGHNAMEDQGVLAGLRAVSTNRPFLILVLGSLVANLGLSFNSTFALFYYRYRLELPEPEVRTIIAIFVVVLCLAIPGWVLAARFFQRKHLVFVGIAGLGLMTCIGYPLFPVGSATGPLVAAVMGGLLAGAVVLYDVMVAETVDYDRTRSRVSQMGLYFGFWKLAGKVSRAVAVSLAGLSLSLIGFEPNEQQSAETSFGLALIFGPGVGVFFIAGACLVLLYPLSRQKMMQIERILTKRG